MIRTAVRVATAALGSLVTLGALAAPAAAGVVPDGCAGSVVYACTGTAQPPEPPPYDYVSSVTAVSLVHVPARTILPGMTVGGQSVDSVAIVVGGQTVPGVSHTVGVSTDPVATGVVAPTNICLLVTCLQAGEPIVVPGVASPVIPVVVPATQLPEYTVETPDAGFVPSITTPGVRTPAVNQTVGVIRVYYSPGDLRTLGESFCASGGGSITYETTPPWPGAPTCLGGTTAPLANVVFFAYTLGRSL
jgi:hypothetical protein